ncbi:MmpS family transport accessory protein [Paractinoplanes hotanensis]|uniref:MmpS family transport accessory protein n=1 Tax=Paractinoplanes hotanensis TaxID=2906497 RepID=A0ABT0Y1C3_9ACTN|nr:MmpS family transport accessory protein [Actinoplanes hotanensis]MCM4079836.1 MmpS family transport accessory protein [Actinoplanes hotanensis]
MLSNQPDNRQPDGTSEPGAWHPPSFTPGSAPLPQPPNPDYPPTSEFPATPTDQFPPPAYTAPGYAQPGYAPPEYAQPGYPPPEYAQPGYPPPQPHPGPPGRPPRKSKLPIVAVLVAITLLLCGGVATAGVLIARNVADRAEKAIEPITNLPSAAPQVPDLPTELPDLPTALPSLPAAPGLDGRQISVTYEVSGEGKASQILYVEKLGDTPKRIENVDLPWKFSTKMETPALVSVVAMRIGTSEGTISCRAQVDGAEVKQRTSSASNVATASCIHFAID